MRGVPIIGTAAPRYAFAADAQAETLRLNRRVSGLPDVERDAFRWAGCCEDARCIRVSIVAEPRGQPADYVLPCHRSARVLFQLGRVIAGLNDRAGLKARLERFLGGIDLG